MFVARRYRSTRVSKDTDEEDDSRVQDPQLHDRPHNPGSAPRASVPNDELHPGKRTPLAFFEVVQSHDQYPSLENGPGPTIHKISRPAQRPAGLPSITKASRPATSGSNKPSSLRRAVLDVGGFDKTETGANVQPEIHVKGYSGAWP